MTGKVYLLWASQGEYDDRSEWPLHAYEGKGAAEATAERLGTLWASLKGRIRDWRDAEPEDAYEADDYDWEWAEKKALRTAEGREFRRLYCVASKDGSLSVFRSSYDLSVSVAEIDVIPA